MFNALAGSFIAVSPDWILKESDAKDSDSAKPIMSQTVWSFCRFLHFIAINDRRNPVSERSKIAIVWLIF
jgi:hypothetical protein